MFGSRHPGDYRRSVVLVIACIAGCGTQTRRTAEVAPSTRALLESAERAEARRDYLKAQSLYERARRDAPDQHSRARAARAYGRALAFYGEHERAARELALACQLDPNDAGACHDLGVLQHRLGDLKGAEDALRRAVAASPRDGRSRIALAALLMKQSRYRDALREYQAMRDVPLPQAVREQVDWAIRTLTTMLKE